jgi:hypothetical protein
MTVHRVIETSYAQARAAEITEYIYQLDDPPTAR